MTEKFHPTADHFKACGFLLSLPTVYRFPVTFVRLITPRSMGTSSGIEQGQRKLLFDSLLSPISYILGTKMRFFLIFLQNYLHISIKSSTFALEMKS